MKSFVFLHLALLTSGVISLSRKKLVWIVRSHCRFLTHCMIKQLSLFNTISVYSHVIVKLQIIKYLSHNSQSKRGLKLKLSSLVFGFSAKLRCFHLVSAYRKLHINLARLVSTWGGLRGKRMWVTNDLLPLRAAVRSCRSLSVVYSLSDTLRLFEQLTSWKIT